MLRHWSQFVPNMSTDIRGHEALQHHHHPKPAVPTVRVRHRAGLDTHTVAAGLETADQGTLHYSALAAAESLSRQTEGASRQAFI